MSNYAFLAWSLGLSFLSLCYAARSMQATLAGQPQAMGDPCTFYIPIWTANILVHVGWGISGNIAAWFWLPLMVIPTWLVVRHLIRDHRAGRHGPPRPPRRRRLRLAFRRFAVALHYSLEAW